jgi:RES domain-containing protein
MKVFRIVHRKWSDKLEASGYAARWNSNGIYVIYCAENASLACLENLVHRNGFGLNSDFSLITISIPSSVSKIEITNEELPDDWSDNNENAHVKCRKIGDNWIRSQKSCILIVPSAIIANEKNIIININHKDFHKINLEQSQPFSFDKRLLLNTN